MNLTKNDIDFQGLFERKIKLRKCKHYKKIQPTYRRMKKPENKRTERILPKSEFMEEFAKKRTELGETRMAQRRAILRLVQEKTRALRRPILGWKDIVKEDETRDKRKCEARK